MSCWRKQIVLRMPSRIFGAVTEDEWDQFEQEYDDVLRWEPGYFAPSLCDSEHGHFIDFYLEDLPADVSDGSSAFARPLTGQEKQKYLAIFQRTFPGFTIKQMDEVHYCEFIWYDGTDAPYCY